MLPQNCGLNSVKINDAFIEHLNVEIPLIIGKKQYTLNLCKFLLDEYKLVTTEDIFNFVNEVPDDTLIKMLKYYNIPVKPNDCITQEVIRVFKPYLSTIRVTLFDQYKHLGIEDPITFQPKNKTPHLNKSPHPLGSSENASTPNQNLIKTNTVITQESITENTQLTSPQTNNSTLPAQEIRHSNLPHESITISASTSNQHQKNSHPEKEQLYSPSASIKNLPSIPPTNDMPCSPELNCNSLKFEKPKVKLNNDFPPEELSDLETLRRVCLSIDKNIPLYPEFQSEQEIANKTRNKAKYARLAAKEKISAIQNNEDCVRINFLDMGGDTFFMIPIKIFGKKYFCLTDSGCQRSILSEKLIPSDKQITATPITLSTCTDNNKKATGTLDIKTTFYTIENKEMTMTIPFVIVGKEYTNNFMGIIGRDILHSKLAQGIDLVRKIFTIRDRETLQYEYFPLYPQDNGIRIKFLVKSPLTIYPSTEISVWVIVSLDERHTHVIPSPKINYRSKETRFNGLEISPVEFCLQDGSTSVEITIKNHRKQFTFQIPELIMDNILAEPIKKLPNDIHLYNLKTETANPKPSIENHESPSKDNAYSEYKQLLDNIPESSHDIIYEVDPSLPPSKSEIIDPLPDNYIENTDQMTIIGESDSIKDPIKHYTLDMIDLTHVSDTESCSYLQNLIKQFSNIFAKHNYDIGQTELLVYDIELKKDPTPQKQRYIKRSIMKEIEPQIKLYLEHDIIEECYNPLYTSNLVLVPKYKSGDRLTSHADMIQQTDPKIDSW